jgi:hypothetical protein
MTKEGICSGKSGVAGLSSGCVCTMTNCLGYRWQPRRPNRLRPLQSTCAPRCHSMLACMLARHTSLLPVGMCCTFVNWLEGAVRMLHGRCFFPFPSPPPPPPAQVIIIQVAPSSAARLLKSGPLQHIFGLCMTAARMALSWSVDSTGTLLARQLGMCELLLRVERARLTVLLGCCM